MWLNPHNIIYLNSFISIALFCDQSVDLGHNDFVENELIVLWVFRWQTFFCSSPSESHGSGGSLEKLVNFSNKYRIINCAITSAGLTERWSLYFYQRYQALKERKRWSKNRFRYESNKVLLFIIRSSWWSLLVTSLKNNNINLIGIRSLKG